MLRMKKINDVIIVVISCGSSNKTRKLSYRKDDRAMRPIYGRPEKFRESMGTPTATFAEIFNGLLFRSILWMCTQNLKFVALPVPEITGVLKKCGQSLDTPTLPFSQIFHGRLLLWTLWMYQPNLQSVALLVPGIIVTTILGWGRGGRRASEMIPFEKALVSFYRPSIATFHLTSCVSEILPLLCSSTPLFPTPPLVSPKFSNVPWE